MIEYIVGEISHSFKKYSFDIFLLSETEKKKYEYISEMANIGQQSRGNDSKLRSNIVKVIWIKMLILMLLAMVQDVMPRAFEILLMFNELMVTHKTEWQIPCKEREF